MPLCLQMPAEVPSIQRGTEWGSLGQDGWVITWGADRGAVAGARGWHIVKAHLIAVSQLHPSEDRLL